MSERIFVGELADIVDRRAQTVRVWCDSEYLPEHLMPERDHRNFRYWTHEQVHGQQGILKWMELADMRPGPQFTDADPAKVTAHVHRMRKPRLLNEADINRLRKLDAKSYSLEEMAESYLERSRYANEKGLRNAIISVYEANGWELPPKFLTIGHLRKARRMVKEGRNFTQIVNYLFRRTRYHSDAVLELDLRRAFARRNWALPHDSPRTKRVGKLTKAQLAELNTLVRRAERLTAHLEK